MLLFTRNALHSNRTFKINACVIIYICRLSHDIYSNFYLREKNAKLTT